jgi:aspartyl/asparaginyl beta-hydroxylase (cupin superfamily)
MSNKKGCYNPVNGSIGVLGNIYPDRTSSDIKLQNEFNRAKESYVPIRTFDNRSKRDQEYQSEFNLLVKEGYDCTKKKLP